MTPVEFEEIGRHVTALREHESLHATDQGKLLSFLVDRQDPNSPHYGKKFESSEDFFDFFYKTVLNRNAAFEGAYRNGQQMKSSLNRKVLGTAYKELGIGQETNRRLLLRSSGDGGYELYLTKVAAPDAQAERNGDDLRYLGTIEKALSEYVDLVGRAIKVEDTTVRWNRASNASLYSSQAINQLRRALEDNPKLQFKSITGPIVERPYMDAITRAFAEREKQLLCRRLPQASPLMNFAIFYLPNNQRKVLFGYGKQDGNVDQTAVFSSSNANLIKEFQRLFQILEKEQVSREITPHDPEFNVQRTYSNEVLVTFPSWPQAEVINRILHSRKQVSICIAGLSTLGLYTAALKNALKNGVKIRVGVWDANAPLVQTMSQLRDVDDLAVTIASNEAIFRSLEEKTGRANHIEVRRLKGWGSLPMMWIDSYLYVGGYWHQGSAFLGPAMLLRESADINEESFASFLMREFEAMMSDVTTEQN